MKAIVIAISADNNKFLEIVEGKIQFNEKFVTYKYKQLDSTIEITVSEGFSGDNVPAIVSEFKNSYMVVRGFNRLMNRYEVWYIIPKGKTN